jgi:DNA-binding response OmpR family regulator
MQVRKKILVVDDNEDSVRIIADTLSREGYEVDTASNGEEALARIGRSLPDLVVLDVMMPKMSGFEVTDRLRSDPRTKEVIILLLTAKAELEAKARGIEGGANDYLVKPIDPRELLLRVRRHLEVHAGYEEKVSMERLAAIGHISLTVRHEINNPLTVIYGQCQLLLQKPLPEEIREKIKLIDEMTVRITQIMRQLDRIKEGKTPVLEEKIPPPLRTGAP